MFSVQENSEEQCEQTQKDSVTPYSWAHGCQLWFNLENIKK